VSKKDRSPRSLDPSALDYGPFARLDPATRTYERVLRALGHRRLARVFRVGVFGFDTHEQAFTLLYLPGENPRHYRDACEHRDELEAVIRSSSVLLGSETWPLVIDGPDSEAADKWTRRVADETTLRLAAGEDPRLLFDPNVYESGLSPAGRDAADDDLAPVLVADSPTLARLNAAAVARDAPAMTDEGVAGLDPDARHIGYPIGSATVDGVLLHFVMWLVRTMDNGRGAMVVVNDADFERLFLTFMPLGTVRQMVAAGRDYLRSIGLPIDEGEG
jgi:hypothetical protein